MSEAELKAELQQLTRHIEKVDQVVREKKSEVNSIKSTKKGNEEKLSGK